MSTFAVIGLAAVLVAGTQNNPPPGQALQARVTAPTVTDANGAAWQQALARARAAEMEGKLVQAIRDYREAAASGSGGAAKRLGEIYGRGGPGVDRDMAEAVRWNRQAQERGEVLAEAIRLR
jgi:serine/threonine-protein kinase